MRLLTADEAARRLAGCEQLDPRGLCTPGDIAAMCINGQCFELRDAVGAAVVVVTVCNGVHWIDAAAGGGGDDLCRYIDAAVVALGATEIGFQTKRRGLVQRAERFGYSVAGYIMRRAT